MFLFLMRQATLASSYGSLGMSLFLVLFPKRSNRQAMKDARDRSERFPVILLENGVATSYREPPGPTTGVSLLVVVNNIVRPGVSPCYQ
jgi:hypothetical protein